MRPLVPHRSSLSAVLAMLALLAASPAAAQAVAPRLRLDQLASRFDGAQAMKDAGVARTAVETSLRPRTTAALGLLCGLQPSDRSSGGASALGSDHDGRFLGAQLRFGFR